MRLFNPVAMGLPPYLLLIFAACAAEVSDQRHSLGDRDDLIAPDDCQGILNGTCMTKDKNGQVTPCIGAELDEFNRVQRLSYERCIRELNCRTTVLVPALALCSAKTAPSFEECYARANEAYRLCFGGGGEGSPPGGGEGYSDGNLSGHAGK